MKFLSKVPYSTKERASLATQLSLMIEGRPVTGIPFMPNDGDTVFWTLDSGNDWKLRFSEKEPNVFEVWDRYHYGEEVFGLWLAKRMRLQIIELPDASLDGGLDTLYKTKAGVTYTLRWTRMAWRVLCKTCSETDPVLKAAYARANVAVASEDPISCAICGHTYTGPDRGHLLDCLLPCLPSPTSTAMSATPTPKSPATSTTPRS
jgi:hypothetical protein